MSEPPISTLQSSSPNGVKVPQFSNSALRSQDELGSLKGDLDWEDISLKEEVSFFEDLELTPLNNPTTGNPDSTGDGQHMGCPQGQEQVLTESKQNNLDFETLMATSLLQHPWDEEREDDLSNSANTEQLFDPSDASLPAGGSDWSSLTSLV